MKVNGILDSMRRDKDVLVRPGVQVLSPQFTKDTDRLESTQRQAVKMIRGLESLLCEERLKELGLFTLEKSWLRDDIITVFQ